jgi:hypothetical protein
MVSHHQPASVRILFGHCEKVCQFICRRSVVSTVAVDIVFIIFNWVFTLHCFYAKVNNPNLHSDLLVIFVSLLVGVTVDSPFTVKLYDNIIWEKPMTSVTVESPLTEYSPFDFVLTPLTSMIYVNFHLDINKNTSTSKYIFRPM